MGPLKAKDYEEAEKQKYALEELQRKDKKNRNATQKAKAKEGPSQAPSSAK